MGNQSSSGIPSISQIKHLQDEETERNKKDAECRTQKTRDEFYARMKTRASEFTPCSLFRVNLNPEAKVALRQDLSTAGYYVYDSLADPENIWAVCIKPRSIMPDVSANAR